MERFHIYLILLVTILSTTNGDLDWPQHEKETGFIHYSNSTMHPTALSLIQVGPMSPLSILTSWVPFSRWCGCKNSSCGCCITYHGKINKTVCLTMELQQVCCRDSLAMNFTMMNYTKSFSITDDIIICPSIPTLNVGLCLHPYGLEFGKSTRACFKANIHIRGLTFGDINLNCVRFANGSFALETYDPRNKTRIV